MYILDYTHKYIINTDSVDRFITKKLNDCVMISSVQGEKLTTLGRYEDETDAQEVFEELFRALAGGQGYYQMPDRCKRAEKVQDARVKRRGGS